MEPLQVTIYNEFVHEQKNDLVKKIYPKGVHEAIAEYMLKEPGFQVRTATLEMPDHGLTEDVLNSTDVLMWWEHTAKSGMRSWTLFKHGYSRAWDSSLCTQVIFPKFSNV